MKTVALRKATPCTVAEPLRILLLDDSPKLAETILQELQTAGLVIECTVV